MKRFISLAGAALVCGAALVMAQQSKRAARLPDYHGPTAAEYLAERQDDTQPWLTKARPSAGDRLAGFFETSFSALPPAFIPQGEGPARISQVGEEFYGYLAYSHSSYQASNAQNGLTVVRTDGTKEWKWRDALYTWQRCGFYYDGKLWLFRGVNPNNNFTGAYVTTCNVANGSFATPKDQLINSTADWLGYFITIAFDPNTETAYGYSKAGPTGARTVFAKWSMSDYKKATEIRDVTTNGEMCSSMTCLNGQLYGITLSGKFVKIATDGTQTEIFTPSIADWHPNYVSAMAWSPARNAFVYNALTGDDGNDAKLYAIDPAAKTCEKIVDLTDGEEYYIFFSTSLPLAPKAPADVQDIAFSTSGTPDLTGQITLTMPAIYADSTAIDASKKITLTTFVDNEQIATGEFSPAAVATVPYTMTNGAHAVRFEYSLDGQSNQTQTKVFTGYDTPLAPASCTLAADGTITWKPSAGGANNALNAYYVGSDVRYDIYFDGEKVASDVESEGATNTFTVTIPTEYALAHNASVVAKYQGFESAPKVSSNIVVGDALPVPFDLNPLSAWKDRCTIVNGGTGSTQNWAYQSATDSYRISYNSTKPADSWLFLPVFKATSDEDVLEFALTVWCQSASYAERFEVKMGTEATPAAMTTQVIDTTTVNYAAAAKKDVTGRIVLDAPGSYYIGIHGISEKDKYYLFVNNFRLLNTGVKKLGPVEPTEVSTVAGGEGALTADITFRLPTKNVAGADIASNAWLTGVVASAVDTVAVAGKPGEIKTVTVKTEQGMNTITVNADMGSYSGLISSVELWCGLDLPGMPKVSLAPTQNDMGTVVSWTPPTAGEHGGWIVPSDLTYELYQLNASSQWALIGSAGQKTSVELTANALTDLDILTIGVRAANSVGKANYLGYSQVLLGPARQMPLEENFEGSTRVFSKYMVWGNGNAKVYIDNPSKIGAKYANDKNLAIFAYTTEADTVKFNLPKVSTIGASSPAVTINFYIEPDMPATRLRARAYGIEEKTVAEITPGDLEEGWHEIVTVLPEEFAGKEWIEVLVETEVEPGRPMLMDSYKLANHVAQDFSVEVLDGPTAPELGAPMEFEIRVKNTGFEAQQGYPAIKWTLTTKAGERVTETPATPASVNPDDVLTAAISFIPTADDLGAFSLKAEIAGDMETANDSKILEGEITAGLNPVVTDLTASLEDGGKVRLEWSELGGTVLESFENATPNVVNPETIGMFKAFDGDGKPVYIFQGWDYPAGGNATSFNVCNDDEILAIAPNFGGAFNGKQYLMARCPDDASQANDWLISPQIDGVTKIRFAVCALTYQYGAETLEVLASSTGDAIADFTKVEDISVNGSGTPDWKEYEVTLPAGTQYFAIRYNATDIFGVKLDAINWEGESDVTGYALYRDGQLLAVKDATPGHLDQAVMPETSYRYNVAPRFGEAEGLKSNTAVISTPSGVNGLTDGRRIFAEQGAIVLIGFDGCSVDVCNAGGITVAKGTVKGMRHSIAVTPGVYVVRSGKRTFKVIVD